VEVHWEDTDHRSRHSHFQCCSSHTRLLHPHHRMSRRLPIHRSHTYLCSRLQQAMAVAVVAVVAAGGAAERTVTGIGQNCRSGCRHKRRSTGSMAFERSKSTPSSSSATGTCNRRKRRLHGVVRHSLARVQAV
jgi:hypothetical protein